MFDLMQNEKTGAPAIITDDEQISYRMLSDRVDNLCRYFSSLGLRQGERVCFVAHTHINTIVTFLTLAKLSACAAPVSARYPKDAIEKHLAEVDAHLFYDVENGLAIRRHATHPPQTEKIFTLIATSASSGKAKIAAHSLDNFLYSARGAKEALSLCEKSRYLLSLPMSHVGGIAAMIRTLDAKGCIILTKKPMQESLHHHLVTHVSHVPTQLYRLMHDKEPITPFKNLRCILLGGAPCSDKLIKLALSYGLPLVTSYGLTEMSSLVTMEKPSLANSCYSSGKPLPFRSVTVAADGEVMVRGQTLFAGYFDCKSGALTQPFDDKGWFATSDTGAIDAYGNLHIHGRKDHMFISGGENIHPETIEKALCSLHGVVQAVAIGVPDPEYGQRAVAFVDRESLSLTSLKEELKELLPSYAIPKCFYPWPKDIISLKPPRSYFKEKALTLNH